MTLIILTALAFGLAGFFSMEYYTYRKLLRSHDRAVQKLYAQHARRYQAQFDARPSPQQIEMADLHGYPQSTQKNVHLQAGP